MMMLIPAGLIAGIVYLSITANERYKTASALYPDLAKLVTMMIASWSALSL